MTEGLLTIALHHLQIVLVKVCHCARSPNGFQSDSQLQCRDTWNLGMPPSKGLIPNNMGF